MCLGASSCRIDFTSQSQLDLFFIKLLFNLQRSISSNAKGKEKYFIFMIVVCVNVECFSFVNNCKLLMSLCVRILIR